jgi:hypothetical protein
MKRHKTLIVTIAISLLAIAWFWVFFRYPVFGMSVGFLATLFVGALVLRR